jgi:hypothetical protein
VEHTCHPGYIGTISRRIMVQAHSDIKQDLISKITKARRAGVMAEVEELLPA